MIGYENISDVYEFGDGSYAYFAVVVKNYDAKPDGSEKENSIHRNEIRIRALPHGLNFTGKLEELDSEDGEFWIPYLTDLIGCGDDGDELGHGFHSVPEVGSLVVVLAVDCGLPGYSQHVAIGSFWMNKLLPPFWTKVFEKDGSVWDRIKSWFSFSDEEEPVKDVNNISDGVFYRNKSGTSLFVHNREGGVIGAYGPSKLNKNGEWEGSYIFFHESTGKLVTVVEKLFVAAANQINIVSSDSMKIESRLDDGSFVLNVSEGNATNNVTLSSGGDISLAAKEEFKIRGEGKVTFNNGKPAEEIEGESQKYDEPEIEPPKAEEPELIKTDSYLLVIHRIVEICIPRVIGEDLTATKQSVGSGNVIKLDMGFKPLIYYKREKPEDFKGNLSIPGFDDPDEIRHQEFSFELSNSDYGLIMEKANYTHHDYRQNLDTRYFSFSGSEYLLGDCTDGYKDAITIDESIDAVADNGQVDDPNAGDDGAITLDRLNQGSKVRVKVDIDKTPANKSGVCEIIRRINLQYSGPDKKDDYTVKVTVHAMGNDPVKFLDDPLANQNPGLIGDEIVINYDNSNIFEFDVEYGQTWLEALTSNSAEQAFKKFFGIGDANVATANTEAISYVNPVKRECKKDLKDVSFTDLPGWVKFKTSVAFKRTGESLPGGSGMSFLNICMVTDEPGNFLNNKIDDFTATCTKSGKEISHTKILRAAGEPQEINWQTKLYDESYDLYILYDVRRYMPVLPLCRQVRAEEEVSGDDNFKDLKDKIKNLNERKYPIFEADIFGADSIKENGNALNKIWKLVGCVSSNDQNKDKYCNMFDGNGNGDVADDSDAKFHFVRNCEAAEPIDYSYLLVSDSAIYAKNADEDMIVKYLSGDNELDLNGDSAKIGKIESAWEKVNGTYKIAKYVKQEVKNLGDGRTYQELRGLEFLDREDKGKFMPSFSIPVFTGWISFDMSYDDQGRMDGETKRYDALKNYAYSYIAIYEGRGQALLYFSENLSISDADLNEGDRSSVGEASGINIAIPGMLV